MPDYEIVAEVPVFINNIDDVEKAVEQAYTNLTNAFNQAGNESFDIGLCVEDCPNCGEENVRATQAGGRALVGMQISEIIFNAEDRDTAVEVFINAVRDVQKVNIEIIYVDELDDAEVEA